MPTNNVCLDNISRGGGGGGKKWHHDGRRTKKINSIKDYISCANFLVDKEIVHENKLAGWGYSAGGLVVASAINQSPHLFKAAILKVNMDLDLLLGFTCLLGFSFSYCCIVLMCFALVKWSCSF